MKLKSENNNFYTASKIVDHKMPNIYSWKWDSKSIVIDGKPQDIYFNGKGSYFIIGGTNYYVADSNFKFESNFKSVYSVPVAPRAPRTPTAYPTSPRGIYRPAVDCFSHYTKFDKFDINEYSRFREHNDCTVLSTMVACEVDYPTAHEFLRTKGNRRQGQGIYMSLFLDEITEKSGEYLGKKIEKVSTKYRGLSVAKFLNVCELDCNYIVLVKGHAIGVRRGHIFDAKLHSRKEIFNVYKIG